MNLWYETKRYIKINVSLYNKSRMMGDYHVRFCERLRVKFPLPTRLLTVMCHIKRPSINEDKSDIFNNFSITL